MKWELRHSAFLPQANTPSHQCTHNHYAQCMCVYLCMCVYKLYRLDLSTVPCHAASFPFLCRWCSNMNSIPLWHFKCPLHVMGTGVKKWKFSVWWLWTQPGFVWETFFGMLFWFFIISKVSSQTRRGLSLNFHGALQPHMTYGFNERRWKPPSVFMLSILHAIRTASHYRLAVGGGLLSVAMSTFNRIESTCCIYRNVRKWGYFLTQREQLPSAVQHGCGPMPTNLFWLLSTFHSTQPRQTLIITSPSLSAAISTRESERETHTSTDLPWALGLVAGMRQRFQTGVQATRTTAVRQLLGTKALTL